MTAGDVLIMKLRSILLCVLFLIVPTLLAAAGTPALLTFEESTVVGSGFNPGKQVVLYGCSNAPQPYSRRMRSYLNVVTADTHGAFRWQAPEPISEYSVWFAIGSVPSDEIVAVPGRSVPPVASLPAPHLLAGRDAGDDALEIAGEMNDVVIVRPNGTVFVGTAIRHGTADLNRGLPGLTTFSAKTLTPKSTDNGASNLPIQALKQLNPSDLVVIVDPVSLRFFAGRLSAN
jgi:hypothetical protein